MAVGADGKNITVEALACAHSPSAEGNDPCCIVQAGAQGVLSVEWFKYTPTSGADIAAITTINPATGGLDQPTEAAFIIDNHGVLTVTSHQAMGKTGGTWRSPRTITPAQKTSKGTEDLADEPASKPAHPASVHRLRG
jgi:hypothetical protein